ncbi:glycosyltransferase family 2 protein [Vibrio anguillarum]|uniref:glycosyltransferase family 2 protein n=1 Tax=Vibrio anguillarum TaxID=55601 RepID=UPI000B54896D|nr:glycosyltransferase family 2 protein [Vibrio anguillarum]ASG04743.1 glycosyl transferase [Vibrio anguillarum]
MNSTPLVSIITPSYNCSRQIHKTISSVINQSFLDWEMIIVDDCSTDNSCNIIEELIKDEPRIKLLKRKWNAGPAIARNVAIENARGRYIAFLDSDDQWHVEKLAKQIDFMRDNNVTLSYTAYDKYDDNGKYLSTFRPKLKLSYYDLLKTNSIGCLTAIYDTDMLGKVYMPNISKRQDLALWLRILKKIEFAYGMDEVLADYLAVQANSVSSNKMVAAKYQWRVYREIEKLSIKSSIYYFLNYAYSGFIKSKL